jgi:hypothetical protein
LVLNSGTNQLNNTVENVKNIIEDRFKKWEYSNQVFKCRMDDRLIANFCRKKLGVYSPVFKDLK